LNEADIQPLRAAFQVRHSDRARVDFKLSRNDLLIGHECVMDRCAVEVAVAHDFIATENLSVEFESAVHILNRKPEVLGSLKSRAQRTVVAIIAGLLRRCGRSGGKKRRGNSSERGHSGSTDDFAALVTDRLNACICLTNNRASFSLLKWQASTRLWATVLRCTLSDVKSG
jgi:hypothetical protein